jgi:hypothetical protein
MIPIKSAFGSRCWYNPTYRGQMRAFRDYFEVSGWRMCCRAVYNLAWLAWRDCFRRMERAA